MDQKDRRLDVPLHSRRSCMSLTHDLDRLDKLILDHAKVSEAAKLRNQASRIREQVEALLEDRDKLTNDLKVLRNTTSQRIEELERHVIKLEDKLSKPEKQPSAVETEDLPHDSKAILTLLSNGGSTLSDVARHFNHSHGNAEFYLEILRGRKLVRREPGVVGGPRPKEALYRILPEGREWLLAHGLSPESP